MWQLKNKISKGFTLLEMLLVLAISGSILVMFLNFSTQRTDQMRLDKSTLQVQQVLNAALVFYVNNGRWPYVSGTTVYGKLSNTSELITDGYLPSVTTTNIQNPWGRELWVGAVSKTGAQYYVATITGLSGTSYPGGVSPNARIVAGRLPLGFVTDFPHWDVLGAGSVPVPTVSGCASGDACSYAVGSVPIPGQNLNNARSVNFASVYSSGACVPVPTCPSGMIPQILVVPVSVSGINDDPTPTGINNVYPLTSFTANAYGPGTPPLRGCASATTVACYANSSLTPITTGTYWRVCLSVVTEKGTVSPQPAATKQAWGAAMGSVLAITRCTPSGTGTTSIEPSGTPFGVFQQ